MVDLIWEKENKVNVFGFKISLRSMIINEKKIYKTHMNISLRIKNFYTNIFSTFISISCQLEILIKFSTF